MASDQIQQTRLFKQKLPDRIYLAAHAVLACLRNVGHLWFRYGFLKSSVKWRSITAEGQAIPWFTYPAIEYLEHIDMSGWSVFEYGSGNSTIYWSRRCRKVTAVEDHPDWQALIAREAGVKANVILTTDPQTYVNTVTREGIAYDLLVIDGSHRPACAAIAAHHVTAGGMVILDDADDFPEAAAMLRKADFIEIDFAGFNPINGYTKTTALFLHPAFRPIPRPDKALPVRSMARAPRGTVSIKPCRDDAQ